MIDVMSLPNKETLEFTRTIAKWIDRQEDTENGILFVFKSDTPEAVKKRFELIKSRLPFSDKLAS